MEKRAEILNRYSRQMLIPNFGLSGQEKLLSSKVLVVGAGGIGSTVCMYLASAGIAIHVMDHDSVELSNLHRQILHSESNIGKNKAISAVERLSVLNSAVQCQHISEALSYDNAALIIPNYDLVIDATDNFEARYIINDACVLSGVPFISGSSVGLEGQVRVVIPYLSPCYRCMHPKPSLNESCRSCANAGVLGPVAGMIGCLQAIEAMKLLQSDLLQPRNDSPSTTTATAQQGNNKHGGDEKHKSATAFHAKTLHDRQTFYDGGSGTFYNFNLTKRNPNCLICSEVDAARVIRTMGDSKRIIGEALLSNASIANAYKVNLPSKHSILASKYAEKRVTNAHIVIDVRNNTQFEMSSFQNYFPDMDVLPCPTAMAASDTVLPSRSYLLHIPMDVLTGGKDDRTKEDNKKILLSSLRILLFNHPRNREEEEEEEEEGLSTTHRDVFVICRRGIDSTVATQYLLDNGFGPNVFNIEGGYTAWKASVDHSFPLY